MITREGRLDETCFEGKVASGVVARAAAQEVPVCVICGASVLEREEHEQRGILLLETLLGHAQDLADAKRRAVELLELSAERLALRL